MPKLWSYLVVDRQRERPSLLFVLLQKTLHPIFFLENHTQGTPFPRNFSLLKVRACWLSIFRDKIADIAHIGLEMLLAITTGKYSTKLNQNGGGWWTLLKSMVVGRVVAVPVDEWSMWPRVDGIPNIHPPSPPSPPLLHLGFKSSPNPERCSL